MLGVVFNSDNDTCYVTRCIHIYDMHNTYACANKLVSNMLFSGSSCWSRRARVLCSLLETMRDMRGNHARQLIVKSDYENSSPLPVTGQDSGSMFWSREQSRPQHDVTEGFNDVGLGSKANTTCWLRWSGSQCNLVSNTSLRVINLRWHSIGWSPIKSMTQINRSLA